MTIWERLPTVVLAICGVVLSTHAARLFAASRREAEARKPVVVSNWVHYANHGNRVGPPSAPVTVVAFVDYQCPFSRSLSQRLKALQQESPGRLAVVFRNFPLHGHTHAVPAALASTCAAEQGKFSEYHDALTRAGPLALGSLGWINFAIEAGVSDTLAFAQCMTSANAMRSLAVDTVDGDALHVTNTPTYLVNNLKYVGVTPAFDTIIQAALRAR